MRAKIIATIGPSSADPKIMREMIEVGFDVARINFSHSSHENFVKQVRALRVFSKKLKKDVKILQDLQGPRIRVGKMPEKGRMIREGDAVIFSVKRETDPEIIFIDTPSLISDIKTGEPIYLSNGEIKLLVKKVKAPYIFAEAIRGGVLYSRKAVNVPKTNLRISGITRKDIEDIKIGLRNKVDYVAISFIQSGKDIVKARKYIGAKAKIIAKIETAVALQNIDEIIQVADGIMIARGDLGVEVPSEKLPFIQKNLVRHAAWHGKPSIIATQILSSMVRQSHPTRAEVSDVANAIFDGADAIMLSDETASGDHPVKALRVSRLIINQTEQYMHRENLL